MMHANLVNLNVNPCKMCMPMGAATALYGLKSCMSILHGSQGCATYIRRHMATHYNEPVDIASSSLTEQGTVFGGEDNLMKGLENLIALYDPEIIGVATTCLAETIGEDVEFIIKTFINKHPETTAKIINISAAGYGGTQFEGFFRALRAVVTQTEMDTTPGEHINIITPMLSPADYRTLKTLLDGMGISYILLPDLSENLDGGYEKEYTRVKNSGTSLEEIAKMAGAKFSIEFSNFISEKDSPGKYLFDTYGVPYEKMALPIGIRDTDAFLEKLESLGGKKPESLEKERSRYIDAMVDSHKYCADGRAAIFGEPDFVYSMTRLCNENGVIPMVVATGAVCPELKSMLADEVKTCAERMFVSGSTILDDCDFAMIETLAKELGVNVMIGSSDGRRISHKLGIGLVRCAFPIHDRVGGQRIKTIGYEGSLNILDQTANIILGDKEEGFRQEIYQSFFGEKKTEKEEASVKTIVQKTETHPCYNCSGGKYARMHLPIAPKCNIQCNYCIRKYDCPNESRPGVTTNVLNPEEAFNKYLAVKEKVKNLTVVGIAGPGDALANFEQTKKTLTLIRQYDENVTFCLSTNGLMLPLYAQELVDLGVSHVTVTINAVDPQIGAKIYKHIDYMGTRYTGVEGASILLANQLAGLSLLAAKGIICKVNTVLLKGINDDHISNIIKKVKEFGIYISNIMQLIPVKGSAFENIELVSNKELMEVRQANEIDIKQMYHCNQCRADAIGTLDNDRSLEFYPPKAKKQVTDIVALRKYAVVSKSGMLVDQHFGQANELYIYESDGKSAKFLEKRLVSKYCEGSAVCGDEKTDKMESIIAAVSDCAGILALRIGLSPTQKLTNKGITVISTYDRIEDAVKKAASS